MSLSDSMDLPPAIACEGITKHYPHFKLQDVNLSFEQGTVNPDSVWNSTAITIVATQILVAIFVIALTLHIQNKKRDFI